MLMIALVLAIAATAAAGNAAKPVRGEVRPCTLSRTCFDTEMNSDRLRVDLGDRVDHDIKMDAYRVKDRPCGLIGQLSCPARGREVFRLGEPVERTLLRSFGLN